MKFVNTMKKQHKMLIKLMLNVLFIKQESIRTKGNRPLRDRNPNTYNLILERPQNELDIEMTLTLMIILIL